MPETKIRVSSWATRAKSKIRIAIARLQFSAKGFVWGGCTTPETKTCVLSRAAPAKSEIRIAIARFQFSAKGFVWGGVRCLKYKSIVIRPVNKAG